MGGTERQPTSVRWRGPPSDHEPPTGLTARQTALCFRFKCTPNPSRRSLWTQWQAVYVSSERMRSRLPAISRSLPLSCGDGRS